MYSIAYYFFQVVLCSALLMGYYWIALRNKKFNQYNRFYLLLAAVLPWFVPLIKIHINTANVPANTPIFIYSIIANNNTEVEQLVQATNSQFNWGFLLFSTYCIGVVVLLISFAVALFKIYKLLKTHSSKNLQNVLLILTQAEGTPFSFFKFIFWNTNVDIATPVGKQMLQHELTHVQEKHSIDKILIQLIVTIGWANPFFWLIKKELSMVHEFIADNKTVTNGDTEALATMLLTAAYPTQQFALSNPFFYSPIKRRLAMLTNTKNPTFSYVRRVMILPLLLTVTLLLAFRNKEEKPTTISVETTIDKVFNTVSKVYKGKLFLGNDKQVAMPLTLEKNYTIMIDAGHGGYDNGAPSVDSKLFEKDIALQIAQAIKNSNTNSNINIVLSRENDTYLSPVDRVALQKKVKADLFISLHCNTSEKETNNSGIEVYLPSKPTPQFNESKNLSNAILNNLTINITPKKLQQRKVGIWVLQATDCPSTLIECGYMTNAKDIEKLTSKAFQQQLANEILLGANQYLYNKENKIATDTIPAKNIIITDVQLLTEIETYQKAIKEKIAFYVIDGKKYTSKDPFVQQLKPIRIAAVEVLKGNNAIKYFGREAINGVIVITTVKVGVEQSSRSILEQDENLLGSTNYSITKKRDRQTLYMYKNSKWTAIKNQDLKNIGVMEMELELKSKYNTIEKVNIHALRIVTNLKPLYILNGKPILEKELMYVKPDLIESINVLKAQNAIDKYGAGAKNGVIEIWSKPTVQVYKNEVEGYVESTDPKDIASSKNYGGRNIVFSKAEIAPEFVGGKAKWDNYLAQNIDKNIAQKNGASKGKYEVVVQYLIDKEGSVVDVIIVGTKDKDYGTAKEVARVIKNSPKWKPAIQNGQTIVFRKQQKYVFTVS